MQSGCGRAVAALPGGGVSGRIQCKKVQTVQADKALSSNKIVTRSDQLVLSIVMFACVCILENDLEGVASLAVIFSQWGSSDVRLSGLMIGNQKTR